jgi:hypothetical protein
MLGGFAWAQGFGAPALLAVSLSAPVNPGARLLKLPEEAAPLRTT